MLLKQSTARNRMIFMTDSTDHVTGKTGLTLTVTISKDGAAFGALGGSVTEVSSGWYKIAFNTTDTNTLGDLATHATATGADASDMSDQVVVELPGIVTTNNDKTGYSLTQTFPTNFSSQSIDASGRVDVGKVAGTAQTARDLGAQLDAAVSTRMATYTQPTGFLAATFPTGTVANTTNITAGTITTATNLTNLPSIPANWLTAAGIAAAALNGKGDWNTTTPPTAVAIRTEMDSNSTKLANLDATVSSRNSVAPDNASVTAIKAKTDSLTFTVAGHVDSNTKKINGTTVNGTGAAGDLWRG